MTPIDPSFATTGAEWSVGALLPSAGPADTGAATAPDAAGGEGFGDLLAREIAGLEGIQQDAAEASRALATGTATDLPSVVAAVERAKLSMELAGQIRTKAVEAYQEIFRTQV